MMLLGYMQVNVLKPQRALSSKSGQRANYLTK